MTDRELEDKILEEGQAISGAVPWLVAAALILAARRIEGALSGLKPPVKPNPVTHPQASGDGD